MSALLVVPFQLPEWRDLAPRVVPALSAAFDAEVTLRRAWFDPETAFDRARAQYGSTPLLRELLRAPVAPGVRILGITGADLCTPVLTFVFGEAQLGGRAAVVSLHRLRPEVYGLVPDPRRLGERLIKEAVHELGHTCGLVHCLDPRCVMHASTYVEEIDVKSASFCAECLPVVRAGALVPARAAGC